MRIMTVLVLMMVSFSPQSDEDKAVGVFKDFVLHLKSRNFQKAAACIHPMSLAKHKKSVLRRFGFETPADLVRRLKSLGYATWDEAEKASAEEVYVRSMKRTDDDIPHHDTLARTVESIVGTLKKNDRVYIVAETKFSVDGPMTRDQAVLHVAYKDRDDWKLATYGESDVGKE